MTAPQISRNACRRTACKHAAILLLGVSLTAGCGAVKTAAVKSVADTLSTGSGDVFTRDDDPELVREASAFGLKMYESLLESVPRYVPLLTATCANFTQYAFAFVQADVDELDSTDYEAITALEARAFRLYMRGQGYCARALEERKKGTLRALQTTPETALRWAEKKDVPLLYWAGAAWGSAISLGLDKPELLLDVPAVRALFERALALDESYLAGSLHTAMISIEARPEMGGTAAKARTHFARAVELSKGLDPGPYVSLATTVAKAERNREEFVKLMEQALAIDPEQSPSNRLPILVTQKRARHLMDRLDELFPKTDRDRPRSSR